HRRPLGHSTWPQIPSSIDRRIDKSTCRVEAGRPGAGGGGGCGACVEGGEGGAADGADAGDPEVDPLDVLGGVVAEAVAVEAVVGVVKGGHGGVGQGLVDEAVRHRDADLEGLAEVAQVGAARV